MLSPNMLFTASQLLLFSCINPHASRVFTSTWPYWYDTGDTVSTGDGKRAAYDKLVVETLTFVVVVGDDEISATTVFKAQNKTMPQLLASVGLSNVSKNDGSKRWNSGHRNFSWDDDSSGTVVAPFHSTGMRIGVGDGGTHDGTDFSLFMFNPGNGNGDYSFDGTFNLGGEFATSNNKSIERIEMYATGHVANLNMSTWKIEHQHSCWESTLGTREFNNLTAAATACALNEKCYGVHDQGCFAKDSTPTKRPRLRLCDTRVAASMHWGAPQPCIHVKPGGPVHGKYWNADSVDHKWCSQWCCCENSNSPNATINTPQFRGEACEDFNECESAPCQNGGTCSESGTDSHVYRWDGSVSLNLCVKTNIVF